MIRELVHDPILLAQPATLATKEDLQILQDLTDTLKNYRETCVGMAANMIGFPKAIIAFYDGSELCTMLNPKIIKQSDPYEAQESCLSLLGGPRKAVRYQKIKVEFQTDGFQTRMKTFSGFTAQIIQHEVDHLKGILI